MKRAIIFAGLIALLSACTPAEQRAVIKAITRQQVKHHATPKPTPPPTTQATVASPETLIGTVGYADCTTITITAPADRLIYAGIDDESPYGLQPGATRTYTFNDKPVNGFHHWGLSLFDPATMQQMDFVSGQVGPCLS